MSDALARIRLAAGDDNEQTLYTIYQFSGLLQQMEKREKAAVLSAELVERAALILAKAHPLALLCNLRHGKSLTGLGRYEKAEEALAESLRRIEGTSTVNESWRQAVIEGFVTLYDAWEKPEEAAEWRAKLPLPDEGAPDSEGESASRDGN